MHTLHTLNFYVLGRNGYNRLLVNFTGTVVVQIECCNNEPGHVPADIQCCFGQS